MKMKIKMEMEMRNQEQALCSSISESCEFDLHSQKF